MCTRISRLWVPAMLLLVRAALAGPIAPPAGPVAPTPGPEPRIAVNATNTPGDASALFVISQPGSYYLAGNITGVVGKHGIRIITDGVTLDLNGFDLAGVDGMGAFDGVTTAGASTPRNLAVRNGSVRDWGGDGIDLAGINHEIANIRVSTCDGNGISIGSHGAVIECQALANSGNGIVAGGGCAVRGCTVTLNGLDGISVNVNCHVTGCESIENSGNGITGSSGAAVRNCLVSGNQQVGIKLGFDGVVQGCTSKSNGFNGIVVETGCLVTDNLCVGNGFAGNYAGIFANGNRNRVEANHVATSSASDTGITVVFTGSGNVVVRNYVQGSGSNNYTFPVSGNFIGTVTGTSGAMNAAANNLINLSF